MSTLKDPNYYNRIPKVAKDERVRTTREQEALDPSTREERDSSREEPVFSTRQEHIDYLISQKEEKINQQRLEASLSRISFDGEGVKSKHMPTPTGWRILIAPIRVEDKTQGGIIITATDQKLQESVRFVGKVLDMGPLCYLHDKFKTHPDAKPSRWCEIGDIVTTSQYAGTQVPMIDDKGKEYYVRVVNDDEILTVIDNTNNLNI